MKRRIDHNLHITKILAILGLIIAAYTIYFDLSTVKLSGFCEISDVSSCNLQAVAFKASFFGIPVSVWMLAVFFAVLASCKALIGHKAHPVSRMKTMFFVSLLGVIISFYLVLLQLSIIELVATFPSADTLILISTIFILSMRNLFYEHLMV